MRRPATWLLAALVATQLATGAALAVRHLGVLPVHGDTPEYLRSSDTLEIRGVRGFLYPFLLAGVGRVTGTPRQFEHPGWRPIAGWDREATQLAQLLLGAASLAYFLRAVVGAPGPGRRPRLRFCLLVALLALEPATLHYAFSILTDSLTLSASLVFCAAFADQLRGRRRRAVSTALLVLSCGVASGLRLEKGPVLAAAALAASVSCAWLAQRRTARAAAGARPALVPLVLVLATVALCHWTQRRVAEPPTVSFTDVFLTQRVVYPHLAQVYAALPPRVTERVDRAQAERFDHSIQDARLVLERASGGDPELRHELLVASARTVAAERRLAIAVDVAGDALENALPTIAFYAHLGALQLLGEPAFRSRFRGDGEAAAYARMTWPFPRLVPAHVLSAAALLLAAAAASLAALRQRRRLAWPGPDAARRWLPAVCLVLANAAAFALSQDLVEVRYALFAHVALLAVIYDLALRWLASPADSQAAASDAEGHGRRAGGAVP